MRNKLLIALMFSILLVGFVSASEWNITLNDRLISYNNWSSFDDSFGIINYTINEGTPFIQSANCLIGECLNMTQDNNLVNTSNSDTSVYDFSKGNKTFNLWMYPTDVSNNPYIITKRGTTDFWSLDIYPTGEIEILRLCGTTTTPQIIFANNWYMLTLVVNDTGTDYYVNGTLYKSCNFGSFGGTGDVNLGYRFDKNTDFNGLFDEMSVWNRSLTTNEIDQLYNAESGITYDDYIIPFLVTSSNAPPQSFNSTASLVNFNCSAISNSPIENITLYLQNQSNYTHYDGVNLTSELNTNLMLNNGNWTYYCSATNSDNLSNSSAEQFFSVEYHPTYLYVTPNSPADAYVSNLSLVNFNCSVIGSSNISNVSLLINDDFVYTENLGSINDTELNINASFVSNGNYNWSCLSADIYNLQNSSSLRSLVINATFITETTEGDVIYNSIASTGAGLGLFIYYMGVSLPSLLFGLGMLAIIVGVILGFIKVLEMFDIKEFRMLRR